jgi:hypothetical protein
VDEERECLVGDWEAGVSDGGTDGGEGRRKETRELLEKVGLGAGKTKGEEGDGEVEDEIKVCCWEEGCLWAELTMADILHFSHALTVDPVHLGTAASSVSSVSSGRDDFNRIGQRQTRHGNSQADPIVIEAEAMHQPLRFAAGLSVCHQRPMYRAPAVKVKREMSIHAKRRKYEADT